MDFEYDVVFSGNKVLTDGNGFAGDGGGICVAPRGEVSFADYAYFIQNEAESGGQGGAIANSGYLVFERASYFVSNTAKGESDIILLRRSAFGASVVLFSSSSTTTVYTDVFSGCTYTIKATSLFENANCSVCCS